MLDRAAAEVNSAKPCIFELVATLRGTIENSEKIVR